VLNSPLGDSFEKADVAKTNAQIDAIVAASNGTIARHDVPLAHPVRTPLPLRAAPPASLLTVADPGSRHPLADPARRTWSFTAIVAGMAGHRHGSDLAPVAGGYDELPVSDAEAVLAEVAGGTTFGTAVHEVLEHVDFDSPTLAGELDTLMTAAARRSGLALDVPVVSAGLAAVIETPLGGLFDGRPLRSFTRRDRLSELGFDLVIDAGRVAAADIGGVLEATLEAGDPLGDYGARLAPALAATRLAGWLNGSIDAVFRVGEGDDRRFVVVDYKTNRLHERDAADPLAAYRPDRLGEAMMRSHYPLQAVLYCVALHRYLRWRLGSQYAPERHLGGVAYLFVRGMVGGATPTYEGMPNGVFSWRPPAKTVLALDDLLTGGGR
jgi:exodeoxyribonuclease V beta subunit